MSSVLEIEQAVDQLPDDDFQAFAAWFDEVRAQREDGFLEAALLEGVRSPHVPYDASVLDHVRQNACLSEVERVV